MFLTTAGPSSSVGLLVLYFSSLVICYFLTEVLIIILIISNSCIWGIFILCIRIFFLCPLCRNTPFSFQNLLKIVSKKTMDFSKCLMLLVLVLCFAGMYLTSYLLLRFSALFNLCFSYYSIHSLYFSPHFFTNVTR